MSSRPKLACLPKKTTFFVRIEPFDAALAETPRADLTILGLSHEPDLEVVKKISEQVNGSCIFVRGSGEESVLT